MKGQNPDNQASIFGVPAPVAMLIVRYYDNDLADAELAELRQALEQSAFARDLFAQWGLHAHALAESLAPQYSDTDAAGQPEDVTALGVATTTSHEYEQMLAQLAELEASAQASVIGLGVDPHDHDHEHTQKQDDGMLSARDMASVGGYLLGQALTSKPAIVAAAAAIVIAAAVYLVPWGGGSGDPADITDQTPAPTIAQPDGATVATLTAASHDAQWGGPASAGPAPGDPLHPGDRLTLIDGFATITTHDGAVAILEAPATVELLDNANAIRLHDGKLVGICETESSQGFVVRTAHMDVTDLGTRFGVDVSSAEATEVHVFEGEVVLASIPVSQGERHEYLTLVGGQAARLDGPSGTFQTTPLRRFSFTESLQTHPLAGTGIGLSAHDADPAWQIVAVDGQALDSPVDMVVSFDDHRTGFPGDPDRGRWLRHNDLREPAAGRDEIVYTVQTDLWIPPTTDLNNTTLHVIGFMDDSLAAIRINDQSATDLTAPSYRTEPMNYTASLTTLGLTHGSNRVQFDLANKPDTATGLLIQWQLVTQRSTTGEPAE